MAISADGNCVSYMAAVSFSNEVSAIVPERSQVFSFCHNQIGSLMEYVAFLSNRIVPLLLNANLDKQLIKKLMEKYKPNYLWLPKDMDIEGIANIPVLEAYNYKLIVYSETSFLSDANTGSFTGKYLYHYG